MRIIPLVLLVILSATPVWSQEQEQDAEQNPLMLTIGDEIRLYEPELDTDWISGYVTAVNGEAFEYKVNGDSQEYTRSYTAIDVIDVKRRVRRQSMVTGALWGLYLGTATGLISGPFAAPAVSLSTEAGIAAFGAAGGLGGAALGAALGYVRVPGKWYRHVLR